MDKNDVRPGGLSSLRDGAVPSPPKASIPDAVDEAFWHELTGIEDTDENREVVKRAIGFTLTCSDSCLALRYQIAAWLRWNQDGPLTVAKAADYVEEGVFPLVISDSKTDR